MRKETENGNFDRPCFVQTVNLRTLLTEVAIEGWNKPAYSVGLECARFSDEWMCTLWHKTDTLQTGDERETWWIWKNFSDSVWTARRPSCY